MPTPRKKPREADLSWWMANAVLDERSLARNFLTAAELADMVATYGPYLAEVKAQHPDASDWELCRIASGDRSVVIRCRSREDVFRRR